MAGNKIINTILVFKEKLKIKPFSQKDVNFVENGQSVLETKWVDNTLTRDNQIFKAYRVAI